jgi:hypothetical protein
MGLTEGGSNTVGLTEYDHRTVVLAEALSDSETRRKLEAISKSLDKEITGLHGKKENLGDMVRYGIQGFTFKEIKEVLNA